MAPLELRERVPMPIEQAIKNFCFHFALLQLFIALLVARIVHAIRMHCRHKYDVLPVRRPDRAVCTSRNVRHLMRFAHERAGVRIEIAHPDLRRVRRFRGPDESFAVRRKTGALLVIRRWIQPPRFTASSRNDPQMRNLRVRREIDIFAVKNDPFTIRRRHRRADAL